MQGTTSFSQPPTRSSPTLGLPIFTETPQQLSESPTLQPIDALVIRLNDGSENTTRINADTEATAESPHVHSASFRFSRGCYTGDCVGYRVGSQENSIAACFDNCLIMNGYLPG